jgi:hypothetical protein
MVALAHVLVLWWLAIGRTVLPSETFPPSIDLWLAPPAGGGAPATGDGGAQAASSPSSLHRPEQVFKTFPDAPPAPLQASQEQPLILGTAPVPAPMPTPSPGAAPVPAAQADLQGQGQGVGATGQNGGGRGGGLGGGTGSGSGAGTGPGYGAALIRGPRGAQITSNPSPETLARIEGPFAVLDCWLTSGNPRLQSCRVRFEHPAGQGVGDEALKRSEEFYYRPPARIGRTSRRVRQVVAIALPAESDGAEPARH